jgi:hypothetical protein
MKNMIRYLLMLGTFNVVSFAQAILPTHISGSFSVPRWLYLSPSESHVENPDFPNGLSLQFSFTVNIPEQGFFYNDAATLDSFSPDPFVIGATKLTRSDIGAGAVFQNGSLQTLFVSGLKGVEP